MKVLRGGAALVAVLMVALATVASVNGAPARRGAALSAAHPAASAADSDPLRKYYSPDDALREGVVSGYVTGPRFPWSALPGQTLQFRVSSYSPSYNVQLVRMFNASPDPHGPGVVETPINAPANGRHTGTPHLLDLGSYVSVPDQSALRLHGRFTLTAWVAPTTIPGSTANPVATVNSPTGSPRFQGLVTKWSGGTGYGLYLASDGSLALRLGTPGNVETLSTGKALRPWAPAFPGWKSEAQNDPEISSPQMDPSRWYFVAASFDNGRVTLVQHPVGYAQNNIPDPTRAEAVRSTSVQEPGASQAPVLLGAGGSEPSGVTELYNGKIDNPRIYDRALSLDELKAIEAGAGATDTLANWNFARGIGSSQVVDTSGNGYNGHAVNLPTRAVTGHNWDGSVLNYRLARNQYGGMYFHQDDLSDAHWPVSFTYHVPPDAESGVYAAKLDASGKTFYIPFFVTPRPGSTAHIALVIPTYSYLAYGMTGLASTPFGAPSTLSAYSQHVDGSGVFYSTALRPLTTMQPMLKPRHFSGDMQLVYWLHARGYKVDILTDENVNQEGAALLGRYRVVITGQHPEYPSGAVRAAYESYKDHGGRLMYLGGNGFYWVTGSSRDGTYIEVRRRNGTQAWQAAPGESMLSTTGEEGGLWRFRGLSPQQLVGVGFAAQGYNGPHGAATSGRPYTRTPNSFRPEAAFIFAGIAPNEPIGDFYNFYYPDGGGAAGDELDRADYTLGTPANTLVVAKAAGFSDGYQYVVEELNQSDSQEGGDVNPLVEADMAYTKFLGDGAVFTVGSIAWDSSLLVNNTDNNVSRVTDNVLRQFAAEAPLPQD